jgi:alpha-L-fucosidase
MKTRHTLIFRRLAAGGLLVMLAATAPAQPAGERLEASRSEPDPALVPLTGGKAIPPGPFQPDWDSIRAGYRTPEWFRDAKFGIFLHWGLYAVPAHQSEWYVRHMYGNPGIIKWHTEHFGPPDKFGYKDFIPLFIAAKFDPAVWAELFKEAGARYVIPTAEHHDGFAMWDSALTRFDAKDMGPHRDLIGDLARAVRQAGLKFGVSNHRIEHFDFIRPAKELKTDLEDPEWADFYSVADHSEGARLRFMDDWLARNFELIDNYHPDLLWFDNGVNPRANDPLKLKVAAYYYNRARSWHEDVSLITKDSAYLAGSILDFERGHPSGFRSDVWQTENNVHQRWGYLSDAKYRRVETCVHELIDVVSKGGNLLLNFSPRADGTIPEEQQQMLRGIGAWLRVNGEAIYGTRPWTRFGEGPTSWPNPQSLPEEQRIHREAVGDFPWPAWTAQDVRFTKRGDTLYAIVMTWPADGRAVVKSLNVGACKVEKVELLGCAGELAFTQDAGGLKVKLPTLKPCDYAYVLKIAGLKSI